MEQRTTCLYALDALSTSVTHDFLTDYMDGWSIASHSDSAEGDDLPPAPPAYYPTLHAPPSFYPYPGAPAHARAELSHSESDGEDDHEPPHERKHEHENHDSNESDDEVTLHDSDNIHLDVSLRLALSASCQSPLSVDQLLSFFDTSALDDQLLSSPTDAFADVCYAQSINEMPSGLCSPSTIAEVSTMIHSSSKIRPLPELPADTAWVADLFEHPIPPSSQTFSTFSPTLASSRMGCNTKLDSMPQVPAHARNLSTGSSLPPRDVISDLAYAFAAPDGPLDEVETFVMPNGGWEEAVEKGSVFEDKEERDHGGDRERDTTVRQRMRRRVPFESLTAAKPKPPRIFCDPDTEVAFLFSSAPHDPAHSVHFFPTWSGSEEPAVRKERSVFRQSANVVLRRLAGLRSRSRLFR